MVHAITQTNSTLHVYLHGYHRARLVRLLPPETRVCITATLFDGLVLALSAFSSSINHRSAVLHGVVCEWDEDGAQARAEKWEAARQITEHVMPGRWADCRQPSNAEMNTTGFVKVAITSASAKCRAGQPGEEKRDLADAALVGKTWAGVIPGE
jgi:nitroimidazol reductase NimA-like FMN-containing flavoprotein (pyridoxamine 5'-phosphate oxidase superfamily)